MKIVDRYWSAIRWDTQHILGFSAYEYFQWVEVGREYWQRRRPIDELLGFFDTLMNMSGSKVNEAVLEDPETIEWMANRTDREDARSRRVPIFGHTEIVSLLKNLIEIQAGREMPRPIIPGIEKRIQRKIARTHSAVDKAQARNRAKQERVRANKIRASKGA